MVGKTSDPRSEISVLVPGLVAKKCRFDTSYDRKDPILLAVASTVCWHLSVIGGLQWQKLIHYIARHCPLKNLPLKYMMTQDVLFASVLFGYVYFLATFLLMTLGVYQRKNNDGIEEVTHCIFYQVWDHPPNQKVSNKTTPILFCLLASREG